MSAFADLFLDMMSDTLIATPGTNDAFGKFTASGEVLSLPCHIRGKAALVRDRSGREVTSSVQVIVLGVHDLTTDKHRYTLPARFSPRTNLQAISIGESADENEPVYEKVYLP